MKKYLIILIILLIFGVLLVIGNNEDNIISDDNNTVLTVSSNGPYELKSLINDVERYDDFEGYDNQTLNWMKSLDDKKVFLSNSSLIIMSEKDAEKINTVFITDASIDYYIDCHVVDRRALLSENKNSKDVIYVKDVKVIGNHTEYYEV